jgi:antitoxin FitA
VPSVQIKDVPPEVHAELRRRAVVAGQSLQEYLLARLLDETSRPTLDEVLTRAGGRSGGNFTFADAVEAIHEERAAR